MNYDNCFRMNYNDCIGYLAYLFLREPEPGQTLEAFLEEIKLHTKETIQGSPDYELQQAG